MLSKFHDNFNNAISHIQDVLNRKEDDYDYEMSVLIRWMLTTDANPYSYLPEGYATSLYSAQAFEGLIHNIHHSLYDDGEITFVKVNGEPRITFFWSNEDNFEDLILSDQDKRIREMSRVGYKIEVLDIKPSEFPVLYENYQLQSIKKSFLWDAKRRGLDFAIHHYSNHYKCYDKSWEEEVTIK